MSDTISAGKSTAFYLPAGYALTVVAASGGTATAYRLAEDTASGFPEVESFAIADAETQVIGPYFTPTRWQMSGLTGQVSWSQAVATRLANVDFMQFGSTESAALTAGGGTASVPISTSVANKNALGFWFQSTATSGDSRGLYLRQYFAGAGVSGEAARLFATVSNVTAATGGTVNGAHVSLSIAGASGAVSGAGNALRATLGIGASSSPGGTLAAIQLDSDFDNAGTVPATAACLRVTNSNTKLWAKFLSVPAPTSAGLFAVHTTDAITHSIRCVDSAGTVFYLMATTTSSNRTGGA